LNAPEKTLVHLRNLWKAKSLGYTYYVFITVLQRRGVPLPRSLLFKSLYHVGIENITPYVFPDTMEGVFVDVGACRGLYTFMVAHKGYRVHAFEPSPEALRTLSREAEKYPNIKLHPYALGEKEKTGRLNLHLACGHDGFIAQSTDYTGETVEAEIKTLDSLQIKDVEVVKIDTEGYELPILRGARETLQSQKPRLVIEIHTPYLEQEQKIREYLEKLEYHDINKLYKKYQFNRPDPQYHLVCEARP